MACEHFALNPKVNMMSDQGDECPVTELLPKCNRTAVGRAVSDATLLTLGVSSLAPVLECLMSHMGASGDARRQMVLQSHQIAALDLSNLAQAISMLNSRSGGARNNLDQGRSSEKTARPDLAVS